MKLLVTGGAGFIGSAVVRRAAAAGHEVVVVDALTYAANPATLASFPPHVVHENVDVRDAAAVHRVVVQHAPDAIVHLAAETHVDRSIDSPTPSVQTNVLGTHHVLEAARAHWDVRNRDPHFRVVVVSTDEVYGSAQPGERFTERSPYAPRNPYAASKAAADHLALAAFFTWGLPVVVTHGSNTYGPFQFPEKLVPVMLLNALHDRPLPLYGDGLHRREWLFVDDHAAGILATLVARPGSSYPLGSGHCIPNIELVNALCRHLDVQRPSGAPHANAIQSVPDRPGHDRGYAVDPSSAAHDLGWTAQVGLEDGLHRTVRWYLHNRAWWEPLLKRLPLGTRLGVEQKGAS